MEFISEEIFLPQMGTELSTIIDKTCIEYFKRPLQK